MKNTRLLLGAGLFALVILIQACNVSTANMSSFKTYSDKEGKVETTSFKAGETVYAKATIANNPGQVKVKFSMIPEADFDDIKKGESIKELETSYDLKGDGVATYTFTPTADFPGGTFKVNADMLNEANEKKDSKSANITIGKAS
jgi:hypothetical protein